MKKSLKMYNVIITALLAVLGFSSCKPDGGGDGDIKPAYGAPSADFVITGNVSSAETNKPIPSLKVVMRYEYGVDENSNLSVDSTITDENGNYQVKNTDNWSPDYKIAVLDTDGDENGAFNDTTVAVSFKDSEWYKGKAEQEVDISLTPKK